jgi:DNA-directed RNA polymerase subunit RPC12/RpoP
MVPSGSTLQESLSERIEQQIGPVCRGSTGKISDVNDVNPPLDLGAILGAYIGFIIAIWLFSAIIASGVAPTGRQLEFFFITLLFLGPIGVGFAAVAQPRAPSVPGRMHYLCPRCAAAQFLDSSEDSFVCWRCSENALIERESRGRINVVSVPKPTNIPAGRRRFLCARCGVTQNIRADKTSYDCWQCGESYAIPPKRKRGPATGG